VVHPIWLSTEFSLFCALEMLHRCTRLSRTLAVSAKPSPIRRASSASLVNKHHVIPTFRVRDAGSSINDVFSVLKQRIESAPAFYKATPLILDFEGHTEEIASPTTLQTVFQELRGLGIFPIGICNANASTQVCDSLYHIGSIVLKSHSSRGACAKCRRDHRFSPNVIF
jgi:hypothetical protein